MTIVHVVAIAVYSSMSLPETTFQRSIVVPDVDSLEMMPEQLVRELSTSKDDVVIENPFKKADAVEVDKSVSAKVTEAPAEETFDVVTKEAPKVKAEVTQSDNAVTEEAAPQKTVTKEVVEAQVFKKIEDEGSEDSDFAERVSYPTLDGVPEKKSRKLAENKPSPVPKPEIERPTGEPAPRARAFSPIPRS